MISPVGSGYTSPIYIPQPELSEVQNSPAPMSPQKSVLKTGIAGYQDSFFEQQKQIGAKEKLDNDRAKAAEIENERQKYLRLTLETDRFNQDGNKFINHYERLKSVDAAEKSEQAKAFHRDQPIANAAAETVTLNAHIKANILSRIRV